MVQKFQRAGLEMSQLSRQYTKYLMKTNFANSMLIASIIYAVIIIGLWLITPQFIDRLFDTYAIPRQIVYIAAFLPSIFLYLLKRYYLRKQESFKEAHKADQGFLQQITQEIAFKLGPQLCQNIANHIVGQANVQALPQMPRPQPPQAVSPVQQPVPSRKECTSKLCQPTLKLLEADRDKFKKFYNIIIAFEWCEQCFKEGQGKASPLQQSDSAAIAQPDQQPVACTCLTRYFDYCKNAAQALAQDNQNIQRLQQNIENLRNSN